MEIMCFKCYMTKDTPFPSKWALVPRCICMICEWNEYKAKIVLQWVKSHSYVHIKSVNPYNFTHKITILYQNTKMYITFEHLKIAPSLIKVQKSYICNPFTQWIIVSIWLDLGLNDLIKNKNKIKIYHMISTSCNVYFSQICNNSWPFWKINSADTLT